MSNTPSPVEFGLLIFLAFAGFGLLLHGFNFITINHIHKERGDKDA